MFPPTCYIQVITIYKAYNCMLRAFTEQSREEIVKSNLNYSRSKQLWTFSKKQRFDPVRPQCPNAFYAKANSTLSHKKISFATSLRRVFTEASDAPLPGTYSIADNKAKRGHAFGESRDKCLTNSYIPLQHQRHPAPTDYKQQQKKKKDFGFTMRPKTPNERNYFLEDKERKEVPAPCEYSPLLAKEGKSSNSRLHSSILGWVGLRKKSPRFQDDPRISNPGPSSYSPSLKQQKSKSTGGCIGNAMRRSFIDDVLKNGLSPGPGNYQLPCEFGSFVRTATSNTKMHQMHE